MAIKSTSKSKKPKEKIKTKSSKAKPKTKVKAQPKAQSKSKPKVKPKPKTKLKVTQKKSTMTKTKSKTVKAKVEKENSVMQEKALSTAISETPTKSFSATLTSGPIGFKPYVMEKEEEYMNDKQLAHFQNILTLWKDQLLAAFDKIKQHIQNDSENFPDPLDRAAQEEDFNLALRTRDRERKLVKKIEDMLDRIARKDYGYCEECGAPIGIRRLEARSTATQCIDCKTFEEIREKQTGTT